jgi:hypothetical protein
MDLEGPCYIHLTIEPNFVDGDIVPSFHIIQALKPIYLRKA